MSGRPISATPDKDNEQWPSTMGRITALQVKSAERKPGLYGDGGRSVSASVGKDGNCSWVFIYRVGGKQRRGQGSARLGRARALSRSRPPVEQAAKGRAMLNQRPKIDPLTIWKAAPASEAPDLSRRRRRTTSLCMRRRGSTRSTPINGAASLEAYCKPLYALRIDQIDTPAILRVLTPIWTRIPETASRVRGRIEAILDYAKADDETRPNPARWRGHLAGTNCPRPSIWTK